MTTFITDDLTVEVERHLRTAAEVCIAAAFVNFQGVELLKKFIQKTRGNRSYNINFLLDKDFHPHSAAREAIIKELYTIPGAKVRVFSDEERRMHMKVYIFSAGNSVSVIAGSHNPTGAGMMKNIEAGLLTSNKKAVREARIYFNEFWSTATEVVPNPEAYYKDPIFQPGQLVRHRDSQEFGIIAGVPNLPELRGRTWYYQVFWRSSLTTAEYPENELRPITVIQGERPEILAELVTSTNNSEEVYLKELLRRKLVTPIKNGLFSYMSSRTEIIPYQFKPLLKILASDKYRILIADEVGLGKTIEAGIIFTELKARHPNFKRVLVLCPTNLKTKWKDELESRFDEYFSLLNREQFINALKNPAEECFGIVSYEFLGHDDIIEMLKEVESSWDLLILDEAHHLRNKNKRNQAVAKMTRQTMAIVMLSATPINLGFKDLINLLKILLPLDYRDVGDVEFGHRLDPNRYLFEAVELLEVSPKDALTKLTEMEKRCKYAGRISSDVSYQRVKLLLNEKYELSSAEVARAREDLTSLNTIANVITRTRKEDVGSSVTREVITYQVNFTHTEQELYEDLTNLARLMAASKGRGKKGSSLAVMMPQRQAASCLPAAMEYLKEMIEKRTISFQEISGEFDEDYYDENDSIVVNNQMIMSESNRILAKYERYRNDFIDTKYNGLVEFLRLRATTNEKLDKVILFTSFRKTLSYLQARLEKDFGIGSTIEIHGDIQPLTERDDRRAFFEDPEGPSILLCTEVGSEGLDMQFANKLVNYDLPWNPMRVEQRIGRIDRHGQLAEKLLVLNFAISGTIEDNVVARLIERIKVFHDSIGPLNMVVGEVVSKLREDLLNPKLTPEQREKNIKKYEQSIEIKARAEERFQQSRHQLMGQDKNFTQEIQNIQQNRRYITPEELLKVVELFCTEKPEQAILKHKQPNVYSLTLGLEAQQHLVKQIQSLNNLNNSKRESYLKKISLGTFNFTTDHSIALKSKRLEYFTINHPVIAAIITGWERKGETVVGKFEGYSRDIGSGTYLLFTYYCEYERQGMQPSVYMYNVAVGLASGCRTQFGDDIYHEIMTGKFKPSYETVELTKDLMQKAERSVKEMLTHQINDTANQLQHDRDAIIRQQAEVIRTAVEKEVSILSQRKKSIWDNRQRDRITKEIEDKKIEVTHKLQELVDYEGDIIAKPSLVGVAWCKVENRGGEE